jgi:Protein of unknown function (DUF3313)
VCISIYDDLYSHIAVNKLLLGTIMKKISIYAAILSFGVFMLACSNTPKLVSESMPKSGFLPNYSLLIPTYTSASDTRVWRYRKEGINPASYTAVILDPIYLNQTSTREVSADSIAKAKSALQASMLEAINARGNLKIVSQPGPGVVRVSAGITGAESSNDYLKPWNFTPIGLAANAAAFAGGVNAKTPALVVENKITDSRTDEVLGMGLVTIQGESFRTSSGSVDSFIAMAQKAVRVALETSATPSARGMQ